MAEAGFGAMGEGFEAGNVKEQASEASEADIARVQETLQKAKQMRGQIQKQSQQNRRAADMFSLLLLYVDDDALMAALYEQFVTYGVSIEHVFAQFLPRIMKYRDLSEYRDLFVQIWDRSERMEMSVSGVVGYMKDIRKLYTDLGAVEPQKYGDFVAALLKRARVLDIAHLEEEKRKELNTMLKREFA